MLTFIELKKLQSDFIKLQNDFENEFNIFERAIEKLVKEKINILNNKFNIQIYCLVILKGGCKCEDWTPKVAIYSITKDNKTWHWNSKHNWFVSTQGHDLTILTIQKVPLPISDCDLELIIKELSSFELPCELVNTTVKEAADRITSFDDIKLLLGENTELIDKGEIWYVGWDIKDLWFIVKNKGQFHVFYSEDAHGFGCKHITPGNKNELDEFFNFMGSNVENNYIATKEKYEKMILDSWKEDLLLPIFRGMQ